MASFAETVGNQDGSRQGRRQQQGNCKIPRNFAKPDVLLRQGSTDSAAQQGGDGMQRVGDVRPRHMEIESRLTSWWDSGETPRQGVAAEEEYRRTIWNRC
jgi:hypothetical protein